MLVERRAKRMVILGDQKYRGDSSYFPLCTFLHVILVVESQITAVQTTAGSSAAC